MPVWKGVLITYSVVTRDELRPRPSRDSRSRSRSQSQLVSTFSTDKCWPRYQLMLISLLTIFNHNSNFNLGLGNLVLISKRLYERKTGDFTIFHSTKLELSNTSIFMVVPSWNFLLGENFEIWLEKLLCLWYPSIDHKNFLFLIQRFYL